VCNLKQKIVNLTDGLLRQVAKKNVTEKTDFLSSHLAHGLTIGLILKKKPFAFLNLLMNNMAHYQVTP